MKTKHFENKLSWSTKIVRTKTEIDINGNII